MHVYYAYNIHVCPFFGASDSDVEEVTKVGLNIWRV